MTLRIIQRVWRVEDVQKKWRVQFVTFGGTTMIHNDIPYNYSPQNVKILVKLLLGLQKQNINHVLSKQTALYEAILDILHSMQRQVMRKKYDNLRLLIMSDCENCSVKPKILEIKQLLKMTKVTMDCIQITRNERDHVALRNLCCKISNYGRFWNPLTLEDWDAILDSVDFKYPHKRGFVYDITMDSDSDSE